MDGWARVKALFLEAVDLPQHERAEWLQQQCADDAEVRKQLEALLESDRNAGTFCDIPAAALLGGETFPAPERALAPGSRLDHYLITSFIGAGGMGEVYRATDTRDGSEVALKTVSGAMLDPLAMRRLTREARHAAALSHPNICSIRGVGDVNGLPYIAMDLIDGRTLADIQCDGDVTIEAATNWAIHISDALEHAHQRGVMHRDLKPSNVMIDRSGRAIILDFGLAKRLNRAGEQSSSESVTATRDGPVGTLSYMAPEILLGQDADERSDIWTVGVLLHYLLTGKLPFTGRTPFQTSAAIIGDEPQTPRSIPLALKLIIERCLAKRPEERYRRAADVRNALVAIRDKRRWRVTGRLLIASRRRRRIAVVAMSALAVVVAAARTWPGAAAPPIRTLAVLSLTDGTGNAAYAEGVTEALVAQLGAASNVRVISRPAPPTAQPESAASIGRRVGSDAVLEGTLHHRGDRLTLDLRLVSSSSGELVWTQTFDRPVREVLALEADAVRDLVDRLDAGVRPGAPRRLSQVPSVQPDVYEAYLKGRYEWNQRTAGSLQRAVEHFERAVQLDPAYAPAHAGLADCYNLLGTVMIGSASPREYRPRAERAAIRALQIDPDSAEAHAALGYVYHYLWRWAESEQAFLRAIGLNPNQPLPRVWYANLLMSKGRFEEALRQAYAGRDVDPFSLIVNTNIGWILLNANRSQEAVDHLTRTVALDPAYPQARWRLAAALAMLGRHAEAAAQVEEVLRLTHRSSASLALHAQVLAAANRTADVRRVLDELSVRQRRGEYVSPGIIPGVYVRLGDYETALDYIERGYAEGANATAYLAVEPTVAPLRGHPRFQALLKKVGLAPRPAP